MNICQRFIIAFCLASMAALATFAQDLGESPAKETAINGPSTLAVDNNKAHLFVAEAMGNRVLRIDLHQGTIKTMAGNGKECCYKDGTAATDVSLDWITSIAVDPEGNLLLSEDAEVLKVNAQTGLISTFAGSDEQGDTLEGSSALSARFRDVNGLAVDSDGNLFIADPVQGKIFKLSSATGSISKIAGSGKSGFSGDGGPAVDATFLFLSAIVFDTAGNIFLADTENCRIRRIDRKTGTIDTIAQTGGPADNCPPQPHVIPWQPSPYDPAVDGQGNIYFAQPSLDVVARVGLKPTIQSIVAGTGERGFSGDGGAATDAMIANPSGLAVDSDGNLYISEFVNNRIRRVDAKTKIITTVAGNGLPERLDLYE